MTRTLLPTIAALVIGLFMLAAGIGPLWLPVLVILAGAAAAIVTKSRQRHNLGS